MLKFGKKDPYQEQERKEIIEKAKKAADRTIISAQKCLQSDIFIDYKEQYKNLEREIINKMMMIDAIETDPVRYGFQMKEAISELKHAGALLRGVMADANKT
jgi:hypothetical protein